MSTGLVTRRYNNMDTIAKFIDVSEAIRRNSVKQADKMLKAFG